MKLKYLKELKVLKRIIIKEKKLKYWKEIKVLKRIESTEKNYN